MRTLRALGIWAGILFVLLAPRPALACSCGVPSASDVFHGSAWVAEITVTQVHRISINNTSPTATLEAQVLRNFKGVPIVKYGKPRVLQYLRQRPGTGGGICSVVPRIGDRLIVWGALPPAFTLELCNSVRNGEAYTGAPPTDFPRLANELADLQRAFDPKRDPAKSLTDTPLKKRVP